MKHSQEQSDIGLAIEREWMRAARSWRRTPRGQRRSLDQSSYVLLGLLHDGEPLTLRAISEMLGLEQSTVNRQVNAAIQREYVARTAPGAGGACRVEPTDLGRTRFREDLDITLQNLQQVVAAMDPAKITGLLEGLREFNDVLEARDANKH